MMDTQKDNQTSNMDTTSNQPFSVGKTLREAREQNGLSVNDVANRIKFAPRQIESLEDDDFARLPEAAFVRGFVRSYARLLDLDATRLLNGLPTSHVQTSSRHEIKSVEIPMPTSFTARKHNIIWLAAALAIAVSLAIFERMHDRAPVNAATEPVATTVQTLELQLPNETTEKESDQMTEQMLPSVTVTQHAMEADKVPAPIQPTPQQTVRVTPAPAPQQKIDRVTPTPAPAPVQAAPPPVVRATPAPATTPASSATTAPKQPKTAPSAQLSMPWLPYAQQTTSTAPAPANTTGAASASEALPKLSTETNSADHALRIEIDEDAWVEIKDGNDKVLLSKLYSAGSLVRFAGKAPLLLTIGNARAVRLFNNRKKIDLESYMTADVAYVKLK